MKAFAASLLALPLLAVATEHSPVLAARGRRHHQRSLDRMLGKRAHSHHHGHHDNSTTTSSSSASNSTCSAANTTSVDLPESLANGSLSPERGCVLYHTLSAEDTCHSIIKEHSGNMTVEQFVQINPSALEDCWGLKQDHTYCIGVTDCLAEGAFTLEQNCTSWAQASSNDTYRSLASNNNVTLADLKAFNHEVGPIEEGLFYCISNETALDITAPEWHDSWAPAASHTDDETSSAAATKTRAAAHKVAAAAAYTPESESDSDTWSSSSSSTEDANTWMQQATQQNQQEQAQYTSASEEESSWTPEWTSSSEDDNTWTQQNTWTEQQEESSSPAYTPTSTWTPLSSSEENTWTQQDTTTTAWEPTTTSTTEQAAATTTQASSGGGTATGDATFYQPGLGSCGWTNSADEYIAAAPAALYAITGDSICGKSITLNYQSKSVTVKITDKCPECSTCSMDLSPAAFQQLASSSAGRIQMTWDASELGIDASVC